MNVGNFARSNLPGLYSVFVTEKSNLLSLSKVEGVPPQFDISLQ
jgi:hypothetical protein